MTTPLTDWEQAKERLRRFAVGGESGFTVYAEGIFGLRGPNTFYEDLRLLLSRTDEAEAWRPISEAPKDGTWFIALQDGETYPCEWREDVPDEGPYYEGWWDHFNSSYEGPTHFRPLPPPPKVSDDGR